MVQLIIGLVIIALIVLYVYLKKTGHQEFNPPSILEDVNLPAVGSTKSLTLNEKLDNNRPQQQ